MPKDNLHNATDTRAATIFSPQNDEQEGRSKKAFTAVEMPRLQKEANATLMRIMHKEITDELAEHAENIEEKILDATEKLETANDVFDAVLQFLVKFNRLPSFGASAMSSSLFASIAIAGLSLLTTPLLYAAAFILGGKPKIASKQISNVIYSGLIFGTALAMFLVPGMFALLGLVAAIGVAGIAVYAMAETYQNYKLLGDKSLDLQEKIDAVDAELDELIKNASKLYDDINKLCVQPNTTIRLYNEAVEKQDELLDLLEKKIQDKKAERNALQEKQDIYNKEIKGLHVSDVVNRGIEVVLACVGLAGAITTLLFPPAGLAILAGGALAGGVYILARVVSPWITRAFDWWKGKKEAVPAVDKFVLSNAHLGLDQSLDSGANLDSTKKITDILATYSDNVPHPPVAARVSDQEVDLSKKQDQTPIKNAYTDVSEAEQSSQENEYKPHH